MSEHTQPASMGKVKRIIRRRLARIPPHEEMSLNIYPMMDMMTILLVFLMMQFANATADVVPSDDLQIPYSTSTATVEDAVSLNVSRTEIVVDGRRICDLRNGQVDPSQKQGGGTGFLITPLLNNLQGHRDRLKLIAERNPRRPFRGEARIIADRRTPFRTITEVIYTLGQAEFNSLRFVGQKKE